MTANISVDKTWDVVIIGAGMGGAAAAYALTHQGQEVLLIEKGKEDIQNSCKENATKQFEDPVVRIEQAQWPTKLQIALNGRTSLFWPSLGCGVGGSTLLYAATLGRLEPIDFKARVTPYGEKIDWPIDYKDLEPYYLKVEELFSVCGTVDPRDSYSAYKLMPPPTMSESDQQLYTSMQQANFNPYRIHAGVEYRNDCEECAGYICRYACKHDARNSFIYPAKTTNNLTILSETEVVKLIAEKEKISAIEIKCQNETKFIRAKYVILAAGSLFTPMLLQKSTSTHWPSGIGNNHGLVGRNLMFHATDYIAVWPKGNPSREGPLRSFSMRDFYEYEGQRYGEFQTMGLTAGYGNIMQFLKLKFDQSILRKFQFLKPLLAIPAKLASWIFNDATVFSAIVEDNPYPDNYVKYEAQAPSQITINYTIKPELETRVKKFRKLVKTSLKGYLLVAINDEVTLNYGHPCGTCRSGNDPDTSVVDKNCKVHGVENLYITDGSFMPTSGGTNPSLTIAANALRVAEKINKRLLHP